MKTKWIKKSLCFLLCLGMATAAMAQSKTPSILERVQNESDPELGYELYRRFAQVMYETLQATHLQLLDMYGEPRSS